MEGIGELLIIEDTALSLKPKAQSLKPSAERLTPNAERLTPNAVYGQRPTVIRHPSSVIQKKSTPKSA
jgi:hypothetical protein